MTHLLDAKVVIALFDADHVHQRFMDTWSRSRNRTGKIATPDRGLAPLHADVAELIPTKRT